MNLRIHLSYITRILNKELDINHSIDMGQYLEMSDELKSQTKCFVCEREFVGGNTIYIMITKGKEII